MELMFLKMLMLIKIMHKENIISIGLYKRFKFQSYVCNGCHDASVGSFGMINMAFLDIHGVDYHCIVFGTVKMRLCIY